MATTKGKASKKVATEEFEVEELTTDMVRVCLLGRTPLIFNRMPEKAKRELLYPRGRKTRTERAESLKHDPMKEYRNSVYRFTDNRMPTRLKLPSPAFKGAITTAALDLKGTRKTEIGRLTWCEGEYVPVYGVPKLRMDTVRSADMNHTPDIRTRACVREWCCEVAISFVKPKCTAKLLGALVGAAGLVSGVGDFRQEKGKGNFGQFEIVRPDDPRFVKIMQEGGRVQQDEALETPDFYDEDTEELYTWFEQEFSRRVA